MSRPAPLAQADAVRARLDDVSVVAATPFAGSEVDLDGVARNARFLAEAGAGVVVCGGNTGEFYALAPAELRAVVEVTVDAIGADVLVVAGAGYRPELAVRLARDALVAGAQAVMLHTPPHPYLGEVGLAGYYRAIARELEGVPLVLYVRGPHFSARAVEAAACGGGLVGVKFALPDPAAFAALVQAFPELAWVCGLAEGWAPTFWVAGARGFTSGLANVAPGLALALRDALRAGDVEETARLWRLLLPFERLRARHGDANNVAAVKAALDLVGLAGGPPRPPLSPLPDEDRAELEQILRAWGVLG